MGLFSNGYPKCLPFRGWTAIPDILVNTPYGLSKPPCSMGAAHLYGWLWRALLGRLRRQVNKHGQSSQLGQINGADLVGAVGSPYLPSIPNMARGIGRGESSIYRYLDELENLGLIIRHYHHEGTPLNIELFPPPAEPEMFLHFENDHDPDSCQICRGIASRNDSQIERGLSPLKE